MGQYNFPKIVESISDPTINDDSNLGYINGTVWVNTNSNSVFICASNTISNAVWIDISSGGSGVDSKTTLYRILLENSPYIRCYNNIFNTEQVSLWSGTAVTYNEDSFYYNVDSGSILTTTDLIPSGENTYSFFLYVNSTATFTTKYSTNGTVFSSFNNDYKEILSSLTNELYMEITFTSSGILDSFGVLYNEEEGIF